MGAEYFRYSDTARIWIVLGVLEAFSGWLPSPALDKAGLGIFVGITIGVVKSLDLTIILD
jgi:hypothetical protein